VKKGCRGGGVNIKDPVPLYIMEYEWGEVTCDFGTIYVVILHQSRVVKREKNKWSLAYGVRGVKIKGGVKLSVLYGTMH